MFAKFIFAAAYVFSQGGNDLPPMLMVTPKNGELIGKTDVYETAIRPPCTSAYECPGILFVARQRFVMCTVPGVWTFTMRLGLIAQDSMVGNVWLIHPDGARSLMATFSASRGMPAHVAGSLQAHSLTYQSCYGLRIETTQPVEVIAEPGISFVTVGR